MPVKPCKPGEIRNPKGKPKGTLNRATILKRWLEVASKNGTVADDVGLALIAKALKGDVAAIKEAFDGAYGKIADKQEVKAEHEVTAKGLSATADFLSKLVSK